MPITRRDYFKPIQIGGCVLWLDGADSSTITGTSPVTQWRDKSVNGYVFTGTGAVISNSGGLILDPVTGFSQPSTTGVPCSSCPGTQQPPVTSTDS